MKQDEITLLKNVHDGLDAMHSEIKDLKGILRGIIKRNRTETSEETK